MSTPTTSTEASSPETPKPAPPPADRSLSGQPGAPSFQGVRFVLAFEDGMIRWVGPSCAPGEEDAVRDAVERLCAPLFDPVAMAGLQAALDMLMAGVRDAIAAIHTPGIGADVIELRELVGSLSTVSRWVHQNSRELSHAAIRERARLDRTAGAPRSPARPWSASRPRHHGHAARGRS